MSSGLQKKIDFFFFCIRLSFLYLSVEQRCTQMLKQPFSKMEFMEKDLDWQGVVAHAYNPTTQEAEAGESRLVWGIQ